MKNIVKIFIFACVGMLLTCSCDKPDDSNGGKGIVEGGLTELQVSGSVVCDKVGVAAVVVSDGTNFTTTDNQGRYTLPLNINATHAYISIPSGYTVDVVNSVPQYWVKTRGMKDKSKVDFLLKKLSDSGSNFSFIAIGDPQVRNMTEVEKLRPILQHLKSYIATLPAQESVPIVVAGDVVFNKPLMFDAMKECYSLLGQPVFNAIGNHDHVFDSGNANADNDKTSDSVFIRHFGPTFYSFNRGEVHFIVLDNILFSGGKGSAYTIGFTQQQLNWVRTDLSYVSKDKAVVVVTHSPTISRKTASFGNSKELHAMLTGYANSVIISGHTHTNSVYNESGAAITEHTIGAMCGAFWEAPVCLDGVQLGYKVFEVSGTTMKWAYVSYTNPTEQFSVFAPAQRPGPLRPAEELLVNVWDWDSRWSVEYSEDGGTNFQPMTRLLFTDSGTYDPVAYQYLGIAGDPHIPSRSFAVAKEHDHMFKCVPSTGITSVTIKAVSSVGKEYRKNISW